MSKGHDMNWLKFLLLSTVILQASTCKAGDQLLPERKECIVKIEIKWPANAPSADEKEIIIRQISSAISTSSSRGGPNYLVNQAIPRGHRDILYLQFGRDCIHRLEIARSLAEYVMEAVPASPDLLVAPEFVEPGPETIEVWGPSWSDSPEKDINGYL